MGFRWGGSLHNSGTVNWFNGSIELVGGAFATSAGPVENKAGGTWNIGGNEQLGADADVVGMPNAYFQNSGTVRKTGAGALDINVRFENPGFVDVEAGRVNFNYDQGPPGPVMGTFTIGLNAQGNGGRAHYAGAPNLASAGAVTVKLNNGYIPQPNDNFVLFDWGQAWGGGPLFGSVVLPTNGFGWQLDYNTNSGPASVTLTMTNYSGPPVITSQPKSVAQGETYSVNLEVAAYGRAPLTYQWFHGQTNMGASAAVAVFGAVGSDGKQRRDLHGGGGGMRMGA